MKTQLLALIKLNNTGAYVAAVVALVLWVGMSFAPAPWAGVFSVWLDSILPMLGVLGGFFANMKRSDE